MNPLQYLTWRAGIEIVLLALMYYVMLRFVRGSRGAGILKGLGLVVVVGLLGVLFLARFLNLQVIGGIATEVVALFGFALLVIFQPELRRALVRLGQAPLFGFLARAEKEVTDHVVEAAATLSRDQVGALIAIERDVSLRSYMEGGVRLDADVTSALLVTIFNPNTPLHDGAVIIQGDRIVAAGCLFPLTENVEAGSGFGTRHRAAIGVTEDSDAIAIVVSEETGSISLAIKGKLSRGLDPENLRTILRGILAPATT
ncbi:MAG TPA: diadenylate cyclase CdaA [Planctomycetota bacterium]|nr:diadenylate cyclase CdaA [Planctomycetota bacterium]HRR81807.1 diadenylate cyclase CdaA [Planctomycetota bacterium]HRT96083.1 diadenylate cyclase CdaA [Planctomycetota bacterium]